MQNIYIVTLNHIKDYKTFNDHLNTFYNDLIQYYDENTKCKFDFANYIRRIQYTRKIYE